MAGDSDNGSDHNGSNDKTGAISEAETAALKERVKNAGWVDTVPVDYNVQQSSRDDELANYLTHSAVYEWCDDYGDVGPEIPILEDQLYGGDFRVRQGNHMNNLQFEVTVEGPDRLQPARSVSTTSLLAPAMYVADHDLVRRRRPSSYPARDCNQQDGLQPAHADPSLHHPSCALRC